jgi:hypothetical protein
MMPVDAGLAVFAFATQHDIAEDGDIQVGWDRLAAFSAV